MSEHYRGRADTRFLMTRRGNCTSNMRSASVGGMTFQLTQWSGSLMVEGATLADMTTLLFLAPDRRSAVLTGQSVGQHQVMVYGKSADHMAEMKSGSGFHIFMPTGLLEAALASRFNVDSLDFSGTRRLVTPGLHAMNRLRTLVVDLYQQASQGCGRMNSSSAFQQLQSSLIDEVSGVLAADPSLTEVPPKEISRRSRILYATREYFDGAGRGPVYTHELCRALAVSERTLQLVFREHLGISPMRYLKIRRLHQLRQRLVTTSREEVSVKKATLEAGLWHLTRHTQDYQKLFGELPSETDRA